MEAIIKKLELRKIANNYYIKIDLTDSNGNNYTIDNPLLSDPISFRKQVFGIMSACGTYDLMKLSTDNPCPKKVIGYCTRGLEILENHKKHWLTYDNEKDEYICKKNNSKQIKLINSLIKTNTTNLSKKEGKIMSILSQNGVFNLLFSSSTSSAFFTTNQIYYGFGYPINIGNENDVANTKKSAQIFTSFIVSVMQFYGVNDLLKLGGRIDKFPLVSITVDQNNNVNSIYNLDTGIGLTINDNYGIVNIYELEKKNSK